MKSIATVLCAILAFIVNIESNQALVIQNGIDTIAAAQLQNNIGPRINRFAIELMYNIIFTQPETVNIIAAPISIWTVLAVTSEGSIDGTSKQLKEAIKTPANITETRILYQKLDKMLKMNADMVDFATVNSLFIDKNKNLNVIFKELSESFYDTKVFPLDFRFSQAVADDVNKAISKFTHGKINKLIDASSLDETQLLLTSAMYFKGQWIMPFNKTSTIKMPFFDGMGKKIGEVNMMYNRGKYPFANIRDLQARVVELPYGNILNNRFSMLVMLPYNNVSLETVFVNIQRVPIQDMLNRLKSAGQVNDEELDCFIPRFKIKSDLDLVLPLQRMGVRDLFTTAAKLSVISYAPGMYVSKISHKAEIETTEEGTVAAAATVEHFIDRISTVRFEANKPFVFVIVDKVTYTIVVAGVYRAPSLF